MNHPRVRPPTRIRIHLRPRPNHGDGIRSELTYPPHCRRVSVVFSTMTRRHRVFCASFDHRPHFSCTPHRAYVFNDTMNTSLAYSASGTVANPLLPMGSVALPGTTCRCRTGIRISQNLVEMRIRSCSAGLDQLESTLARSELTDWNGTAAESFRSQLTELHRLSTTLKEALRTTSRTLWSVGAA